MKNRIPILTFLIMTLIFCSAAIAGEVPGLMEGILSVLKPALEAMGGQYGWLVAAISWTGTLRYIMKPLMVILRGIAAATKTRKDDKFLDSVETSPYWKGFLFLLDYFASAKLQPVRSHEKLVKKEEI